MRYISGMTDETRKFKHCLWHVLPIFFFVEENYEFLLELAEEYQIKRVKELCTEYLLFDMHDKNCERFYVVAEKYGLRQVMQKALEESNYRTLRSFESDDDFVNLPNKTKVEFLKFRVQELEETLKKYVTTCSELVSRVYKMVARQEKGSVCDNYEAHHSSAGSFMLSCQCCQRRVERSNCQISFVVFQEYLKTLFDLGHQNRTVQRLQREVTDDEEVRARLIARLECALINRKR